MHTEEYLKSKRKFIGYSLLAFGIPVAVGWIWVMDAYHNAYFSLFVAIIAFLGAYLWGVFVWELYLKHHLHHRKQPDK
jgi:hypothetical protein